MFRPEARPQWAWTEDLRLKDEAICVQPSAVIRILVVVGEPVVDSLRRPAPTRKNDMRDVLDELHDRWQRGEKVGVGTVVATFSSSPREAGAAMLVASNTVDSWRSTVGSSQSEPDRDARR